MDEHRRRPTRRAPRVALVVALVLAGVATWKVFPVDPAGPARPLTGLSPRTPEGIGVGATVARLRTVYRDRLEVWGGPEGAGPGFRVAGGAPRDLHGSLGDASPAGKVRSLAAGATCGE